MKFLFEKVTETVKRLRSIMFSQKEDLSGFLYKKCGYEKIGKLPPIEDFSVLKENERIVCGKDDHFWIYREIHVKEDNTLLFVETGDDSEWHKNNPQLIVYVNGEFIHQLDENHRYVEFEKAGRYSVFFYGYVGYTALFGGRYDFRAYLTKKDKRIEKLAYHLEVPLFICSCLEEKSKEYVDIISVLDRCASMIDFRAVGSSSFYSSVERAAEYIETALYGKVPDKGLASVVCIGHTHLDVAWLWTVRQSREKMIRSMSMVVSLMKKYPEYKFMMSQPQLLEFVKEDAPNLYAEIKSLVKEGRFEVEGAMWVEADCNLPSGESLVRQILYGKKFFKEEFEKDCEILWLPDVFGYSAALPQILRKSGVNTFVTSKLGWNENNRMPNDTFMWRGIDGTEIFTYFLTCQEKKKGRPPVTETGYVNVSNPQTVQGTWERYQNKELTDEVLLTFGYGDGGGGPNAEMLEYLRRTSCGINGCPKTRIDTVTNFFADLKKKAENNPRLKKWVGELYLECHRGTYTTVSKNKRNNRKSEYLLYNAELFSCISTTVSEGTYDKETFEKLWKILLINQFHDILPGSSIREVYDVSDAEYAVLKTETEAILNDTVSGISKSIDTEGGILVFNPNSSDYSGCVEIDEKLYYTENIPACGYAVLKKDDLKISGDVNINGRVLENSCVRLVFGENMNIISMYDKRSNREILREGAEGNVIEVYEDMPRAYEAWEISSYYKEKKYICDSLESVEKMDLGAAKGFLIRRSFENSTIVQKILLYENSSRIDFDTILDWQEEKMLAKAAFPTNVLSNEVTCDIQFGNVKRSTHRNTSWDEAKFEICAHKFIDLSENGFGVSLMNDCKYGYDVIDSDMRLTLVKCSDNPGCYVDKGIHRFVYSVYPHSGNFSTADVETEAFRLNNPVIVRKIGKQSGTLPKDYSFVRIADGNAQISAIKQSEDGNGLIVRLYEKLGGRSRIKLRLGFNAKRAWETDMMENKLRELNVNENELEFEIMPYEIKTIKLV